MPKSLRAVIPVSLEIDWCGTETFNWASHLGLNNRYRFLHAIEFNISADQQPSQHLENGGPLVFANCDVNSCDGKCPFAQNVLTLTLQRIEFNARPGHQNGHQTN